MAGSPIESLRTIVSGNPDYGIASAIRSVFPHAKFFSRSHGGMDFTRHENLQRFAEISLDYDLFVCCSSLSRFRQVLLIEAVYKQWKEKGHRGHIIALGSTADAPVKGTDWIYPIEKKALRAFCRNLSMAGLGGHGSRPSGIRVSYLSPGYVDTPRAREKHPDVHALDPIYVARMIEWLALQPENVNVSELCLDPIQIDGGR